MAMSLFYCLLRLHQIEGCYPGLNHAGKSSNKSGLFVIERERSIYPFNTKQHWIVAKRSRFKWLNRLSDDFTYRPHRQF